jgi:ketosteroid isomerase-like protein
MTVKTETWMKELFQSIDEMNTEAFLGLLTDDVSFHFGNADPVEGKAAVGEVVGGFFESIRGIRHEVEESFESSDNAVCHGRVIYTRHDGSSLNVPFANVFKLRDGRARDYRIFVDISALYS